MQKEQKVELYNHAQSYEMKIRESMAEAKKYLDITRNLEGTIARKSEQISYQEQLAEEQA